MHPRWFGLSACGQGGLLRRCLQRELLERGEEVVAPGAMRFGALSDPSGLEVRASGDGGVVATAAHADPQVPGLEAVLTLGVGAARDAPSLAKGSWVEAERLSCLGGGHAAGPRTAWPSAILIALRSRGQNSQLHTPSSSAATASRSSLVQTSTYRDLDPGRVGRTSSMR